MFRWAPFQKLDSVFSEIGAELLQRFPEKLLRRRQKHQVELAHTRIWGWTYFQGPNEMYLGYGVYFVPLSGSFSTALPSLPEQEQAFLVVGSDGSAISVNDGELSVGWSRLEDGTWLVIKPIPLSNRRNGERFPQFIIRSIQENIDDISKIVDWNTKSLDSSD